jgi:hypothetical protein
MNRTPVTSSNIKSIGWEKGTLEVEYHNVPASKHASLLAEDSKPGGSVGGHLAKIVKPHHGFTKVSK